MESNKGDSLRKRIFKIIRNNVIMIAAGAAAGLFLLFIVHCIPLDRMAYHVWQSLPMIEYEFEHESLVENYPGSFIGNFTDCLMLENSIYENDSHTVMEQMLFMYRGESGTGEGWAPGYSLSDYLSGVTQTREESYARYWHGYLVILKPLLYLTTFNSIRMIQAALQLVLTGLLIVALSKKGNDFLGKAFVLSLPFMYFFSLYASLSLSICFYIMTAAVLTQTLFHDKVYGAGYYCEFFVLIGMATAYFDFLTYPLITLIYPLCVYLWLSASTGKKAYIDIVKYTVEWSVGYAGLWASKWIITDCLYGEGIIKDAVNTMLERTSSVGKIETGAGFSDVLASNLEMFKGWGFYLLIAGIVIWIFCMAVKNKLRKTNFAKGVIVKKALPYILVGLYPFIWFFFTQNHSYEHAVFTCRILSASVFAFICAAGKICER
jgi:hypothetical protein